LISPSRFNLLPKLHRRARQLALSLNQRKYHHEQWRAIHRKSLNVVACAYQENINEIIGNLTSEGGRRVYSDVVIGATDVIFSRLEALDTTLSEQSQSILLKSIQFWTMLLLKVRTKISDIGWQTLLSYLT
jgi:hypothetical protein